VELRREAISRELALQDSGRYTIDGLYLDEVMWGFPSSDAVRSRRNLKGPNGRNSKTLGLIGSWPWSRHFWNRPIAGDNSPYHQ
jgi:hypothetical protein